MFREFVGVEPVLMSQKIQDEKNITEKSWSAESRFGRDILGFI